MSKIDYINRINRVIDYIETHLAEDMSLEDLSAEANFSPYHFHRIFTAFTREPVNRFIKRLRLERAAAKLVCGDKTITEITFDCGFKSSSVFARSFKEYFGKSATEWRNSQISKNCKENSNNGKMLSKNSKAEESESIYHLNNKIIDERRKEMNVKGRNVRVENLQEMTVAYVRHVGPYAGDEKLFESLYEKIFKWAGARDLLNFPETKLLSVYHDDPGLTDESKLRTSICITVPPETVVDGEIGKMVINSGKYAMAEFEIDADQYGEAWNWICGEWLPESGYEAADGLCYELSKNNPKEHPEGKHIFDICIPVKPA